MTTQVIKVLLIENNNSDAECVRHLLIAASLKEPDFAFNLEWVTTLTQGLTRLNQGDIEVVVTDLGLADSHGLEAPQQLMAQYPDLPIVVLTGTHTKDCYAAIHALQLGAQDYLTKDHLNGLLLSRTLRYAIERKRLEMRLTAMALHDPLTGLSTRIHLNDRTNHALTLAHRNKTRVAVLFLDIDKFKQVNDHLGHAVGDMLLKGIAERLTRCLRKGDTIARVGGDEFVIVMPSDVQEVTKVAEKVIETFSKPFTFSGHTLFATTSVGIALYPENGNTMETLMQNADAAMYFAKENGRNNFQFYTEAMHPL